MECLAYNQQRFASVINNINKELNQKGFMMTEEDSSLEATSSAAKAMLQQRQLLTDMRAQNYDVIRFATYRTACKLRFVQKKTNLHLIDIWNVIQAFRENGLNSMDPGYELSASKVESILATLFTQLNKRLPAAHQIEAEECKILLLNWILTAYDKDNSGKTRVLSIKVILSTLCSGKLVDKLRYIFTQLSDSTGCMIWSRFEVYLRDILTLPTAVFEGPSFGFNQSAARSCFEPTSKVNINDFLSVMMADPGPQCLMWLPILTRMATVENTLHPIPCEGCHRQSFTGFRYKCDRCHNYQLCQDCFWRGRVSGNHNIDHPMKEYKSYKSHVKQLGHSIKKSFQCVPHKTSNNHKLPHFPEAPEKKIDLSFIVPPTPIQSRNGLSNNLLVHTAEVSSIDSTCSSAPRSPSKLNGSIESCRIDDEHRLIARYASRLAADAKNAARSPSEVHCSADSNRAQRELIGQLEAKNREIMREIQRLRLEQEAFAQENAEAQYNPTLLAELRILRQRKDELESRMQSLQESRKELMVQLETLMKLLKNQPSSQRSTPNSSPRSRNAMSPTIINNVNNNKVHSPSTPMESSLTGLGGDVRQAFSQRPSASINNVGGMGNFRQDLLVAADSVTNAMSSLVKELNSENSDEDEYGTNGHQSVMYESDAMIRSTGSEEMDSWKDDIQWRLKQESEFLAQLRARRQRSANSSRAGSDTETDNYIPSDGESYVRTDDESALATDDVESYDRMFRSLEESELSLRENHTKQQPIDVMTSSRYSTDQESFLQTDDESFIRTDDEEGGGTDWEESNRRWINR